MHESQMHPDSLLVDLIASAGDPRRTLDLILRRIQTATGADRVSVGANRERATGTEILVLGGVGGTVPFLRGGEDGITGLHLIDSPAPLPPDTVWEELGVGEDPHPLEAALVEAGYRSGASFGLRVSGRSQATLYVLSREPAYFNEDRRAAVCKYLHSAAVVSHHLLYFLRHERQQHGLAASQALVDELTAVRGLAETCRRLVEAGVEQLELQRLALFLADTDARRFTCVARRERGNPVRVDPLPELEITRAPGLRAALAGMPLAMITSRQAFPDSMREALGLSEEGWLLLIPLRSSTGVLGLLVGQTGPELPAPATADMEAMQFLGLQLGLVIENRQTLDLQERNTRNLAGLLGMSQAVASLVDLERVPELVARHARDLCDADEATVFLEEDGTLRPLVCLGAYAEQVMRVRIGMGEGLTGRVAQSRRGEILNHADSDPRVVNVPDTPQEQESLLSVPLIAADRLIGVLTLHKLQDRVFDPADLDTLEIFAAQAAAAMKSARLLEDLREERSRLVTMLQQMEAGVVFAGREGQVILLNAAARKLLGVEEEDIEDPLPELLRRVELTELLEALETLEAKGDRHATREESIGGRTFICSLTTSRDEGGVREGTILLFKDVTELKEIELQLLQSSKMSAVGQLAAGIAHEFNNLIAAIYGYAQFMKEHPDEKTVRKGVEVILRASERARGLTGSLLTYSRRRPGRHESIDLNRLLRDTLLLLSRQLERSKIDVETDLADLPPTVVDAGRIQQVFLDLLLNAQQAMAQGGRLLVRSRTGGGGIEIEVEDTGPGIPAAIQDRIFEPFFTTKGPLGGTKTPGTGLGLSVAYNVLQDHGGSIRVRSEPGRGACFHLDLPVSREEATRAPAPEAPDGSHPAGRILVAEDDPRLSRRILEVLDGLGHQVIAAGEGEGLADMIAAEEIHMLLLSRRSTAHDPLLTYQRVRQAHPRLPVVFLTERGDTEPLEAEGDSWIFRINKPFRDRDLTALVSRILNRHLSDGERAA